MADAVELADLSQEDPFAGPADPKLVCDPSTTPDLELYDPAGDLSIAWNDPAIGIAWPLDAPLLSAKDQAARPLDELADRLPRFAA